jgi:hypothetical protein
MKTLAEMPRGTQEELTRLHHKEIAAYEIGQTATAVTCRLRWVALYLEAGGCSSPQPQFVVTSGGTAQANRRKTAKAWKEEQDARPLVAVTKSQEVIWSDNAGVPHCYYVLTLACGHQVEDHAIDPTANPAKRRRCKECGTAILEARHAEQNETLAEKPAEIVECPNYGTSQSA